MIPMADGLASGCFSVTLSADGVFSIAGMPGTPAFSSSSSSSCS